MEQRIITLALKNRDAFNKLQQHNIKDTLSTQGALVWDEIKDYYARDGSIFTTDPSLVLNSLLRKYPKHTDLFKHVIQEVADKIPHTSVDNILHDIKEQTLESIKLDLISALNSTKSKDIPALMDKYREWSNGMDLERVGGFDPVTYDGLVEFTRNSNGILLLPKELNTNLKNRLTRKNHVVVFALPDVGKTTYTINSCFGFVMQGLKVLYIANEEPAERVYLKFLTRLSGKDLDTVEAILQSEGTVSDILPAKRLQKLDLFFIDDTFGETEYKLQEIIDDIKPDILVVDQIRNIEMRAKSAVEQKEAVAKMMRRLAKKNDLLSISVTQAADSARGKVKLNQGDVDGSNIGIPGTADLMIGITSPNDENDGNNRWLSFPKNKISGFKDIMKVMFDFNYNWVRV